MTLRLVLMRHAKSDWSSPGGADRDRPLNARGERAAQALGDWLRAHGYLPDLVLCSSARRTRQTLAGLALDAETRLDDRLYNADPATLLSVIRAAGHAGCLMVIAHNPGIAWLAERMLATPPAHPRFGAYPTGATLVADFDASGWSHIEPGTGRTIDFTVPRDLAG
jgi:phosphohistidine phosphatase